MYAKTAFANEIAGAISLHSKLGWVYAHHPHNVREELIKTCIDLVALTSVCMLTVRSYKKKMDEKDALATGVGTLLVAFVIPNLFLHKTVAAICKSKCGSASKVGLSLGLVYVLFKLEHPVVAQIRKLL